MKTEIPNQTCFLPTNLSFPFLTRTFLCLVLAWQLSAPVTANEFKRGPLVQLSDPDPLGKCPGGLPFAEAMQQEESFVTANPTNSKNIVAVWIGGKAKGIVAGVTFDGGRRWQQVVVPGVNSCASGPFAGGGAVDPWVSLGPNGDVFVSSLAFGPFPLGPLGVAVNKSSDGGLHWSDPILLDIEADARFYADKPSITADPTDARFVYAVWNHSENGNRGPAQFSRTIDGGQTWEPARILFDAGTSDQVNEPTVLVSPDGTLLAFFLVLPYANANGGAQKDATLSLIRSVDKGLTWSAPIAAARVPATIVTDPDTGQGVASLGSYPQFFSVAVDAHNGQLYAVWEDTRFSGGQYTSVALVTSPDGGFTWSTPIPINKTPANIAPANRQAFLPAVAVATDGTVGVTYYDFRFNTPAPGVPTDYWLIHCHPTALNPPTDARNWVSETRLTDRSFNLEAAHFQFDAFFMGDYVGLATTGNDFVATFNQASATDSDSVFVRRVGP